MSDGEATRLVAWGAEVRAVHDRLRGAPVADVLGPL